MFNCSGILLCDGTQRSFTKIINYLKTKSHRKHMETNLDRIRCCIEEESGYIPEDKDIWMSIRSTVIQRVTRNFLWKCIHDIFPIGHFWNHIENSEILGQCPHCKVDETMEHIMLDCASPGQHQIWMLCAKLWELKHKKWPRLN
ncbi:hypothetical protein C8R45DRAFT_818102 [Mycena sanguinolenta]|nr:hypothetical protein C8R45DRAFT_818102 [Mycena sanguinolenta]